MNNFNFEPTDGLRDKNYFATRPANEEEARAILQTPLDQLKDFINQTVVNFFNNGGEIGGDLRPSASNTGLISLGNADITFKDLFLSGVSKSTNGYTKLPNGMIMQWGSISLTSGSKTDFTPPIAFPTQCLIISATLVGGTTYSNLGVTSGINSNNSLYALQSTGATRPINWFAIGY